MTTTPHPLVEPDEGTGARVERLLAGMTTAEKTAQLTQYFHFGRLAAPSDGAGPGSAVDPGPASSQADPARQAAAAEQAVREGRTGSLLFVTDPAEINRLQRLAVAGNRLGLPLLFGFDVIHGLRTILPVPIALAASFDPPPVEEAQAVAAVEARAVGVHWTFAPMVDLARDPRWGRIVEGAGEDPYLGAAIAAAQVRGFTRGGLVSGPKHWAGYGAALGGRDYDEVHLSEEELRNNYLPPFAAAVAAGADTVMTAYMDYNGVPATGNRWLIHDVLRDEIGFRGMTVSDADAVRNLVTHGFARDAPDAAARALAAGVDMEMAIADPAFAHLPEALESGRVTAAELDDAVRRVLAVKLRAGIVDEPFVDAERARAVLSDPAHREVARRASERSAVLLRNEGGLLPLDAGRLGRVAVIGHLAASARDTIGPWAFDFELGETVTVLDGIRAHLAAGTDPAAPPPAVTFAPGVRPVHRDTPSVFDAFPGHLPAEPASFDDEAELTRAVALAAQADVAIVVIGEEQHLIGETGSRAGLDLPGRQLELLQRVTATGTDVVVVLMSGRPLDLTWAAGHVPSILQAWYPGTQGGAAIARLLFGAVAPGGKLPMTWPRSAGQIPIHYAHTRSHDPANQDRRYWDLDGSPLFVFGHGLTYTEFRYDRITVDRPTVRPDEEVAVTCDVTNVGDRAAEEVVQLYLHQRYGSASRPVRELKGFRRIAIEPGRTATVRFTVGADDRRYFSAARRAVVADESDFDVWIGSSSAASLHSEFSVRR